MVTAKCGYCRQQFRLRNGYQIWASQKGHSVYCSQPCRMRGSNKLQARNGRIYAKCHNPACGKKFTPSNGQLARKKSGSPIYCSRSCSSQSRVGIQHPRGATPERSHLYRDIPVRCPWAAGTMPTQWREVPIW